MTTNNDVIDARTYLDTSYSGGGGGTPVWVELDCISSEGVTATPQLQDRPRCRRKRDAKQQVTGIRHQATLTYEIVDSTDITNYHVLREKANDCEVARIAYLYGEDTDPTAPGTIMSGVLTFSATRDLDTRNGQITHDDTDPDYDVQEWPFT